VGAYNSDADEYLIVYHHGPASTSNRDLYARRVTTDGQVTDGGTILLATEGVDQQWADVVYVSEGEQYAAV
jgi:hypothetical protein